MATLGEMDSGSLKGAGGLMEVKTRKHQDVDYWWPNRGGCLIGGC